MTNILISFLLSLLGELGKALKVLFQKTVQDELAIALPIAKKLVVAIATDNTILTSEDKRKAAFSGIVAELLTENKKLASSTINLAIELAVKTIKQETAKI